MSATSVNLKNTLNKFQKFFGKNISLVFWLMFILILVYEFFVISRAIKPILHPEPIVDSKKVQGVRYNFNDYNEVVKNIAKNKVYDPEVVGVKNPFLPGK